MALRSVSTVATRLDLRTLHHALLRAVHDQVAGEHGPSVVVAPVVVVAGGPPVPCWLWEGATCRDALLWNENKALATSVQLANCPTLLQRVRVVQRLMRWNREVLILQPSAGDSAEGPV
eukprot:CAMPEP_0171091374 /NCGR_PEP_ID=MMETSP0766_2-20121228/32957_1 /TAXON_ID=439317 /ORGANISM="Gambierdiscus australes, Strain CAWD 149" /LENGTH=118 /DNA_ID=CAMNT_0011549477 /DNA_START=330 /DNA_END=686 /DNA_ORIENTATION=+